MTEDTALTLKDLCGVDITILVKRDVNILEITMANKNELTPELIEVIARATAKEVMKELSPVQVRADAKGLLDYSLKRFGMKPDWTERGTWATIGAAVSSLGWVLIITANF